MNKNYVNKVGYAEMYEWKPDYYLKYIGRLVDLDSDDPSKIVLAHNTNDPIGVTSINFLCVSNNPNEWHDKYAKNNMGDTLMNSVEIAYATNEYDQVKEFAFMSTKKANVYMPQESKDFDKTKKYVERLDRIEWSPVVLLGRCIVFDNGTCGENDKYCQLYTGNEENLFGSVVPAKDFTGKTRNYRIIRRYSEKTLEIFFK